MKKNNKLQTLGALAFNFIVGLAVAWLFGATPVVAAASGAAGVGAGILLAESKAMPQGAFFVGLLKEVWIAQLMELFYPGNSWMLRSQDMSAFVTNNVINLADIGADPSVLVDNTSYPVSIVERTDTAIQLTLKTLDTVNTVVRNVEAIQLAYDKRESVVRQHRNALMAKCSALAAWNYGPAADGAYTPVSSLGSGSIIDALYTAQQKLNSLNAPIEGRVLTLNPTHQAKLLKEDKSLYKGFADPGTGQVFKLAGFDIYSGTQNPVYDGTTHAKKAFGASAAGGDLQSSIFWLESEVMRADGTVEMFARLQDPEARGDIMGFQKRFVALSIRNKYSGAITD